MRLRAVAAVHARGRGDVEAWLLLRVARLLLLEAVLLLPKAGRLRHEGVLESAWCVRLVGLARRIGEGRAGLGAVHGLLLLIRLGAVELGLLLLTERALWLEVEAGGLGLQSWEVLLHGLYARLLRHETVRHSRLLLALESAIALWLLVSCLLWLHGVLLWVSGQLRLQRRNIPESILLRLQAWC